MRSDPFYLKLDHVAASISPLKAVEVLVEHANRLGIAVECNLNEIHCFVMPGVGTKAEWAAGYERATEFGLKVALPMKGSTNEL